MAHIPYSAEMRKLWAFAEGLPEVIVNKPLGLVMRERCGSERQMSRR